MKLNEKIELLKQKLETRIHELQSRDIREFYRDLSKQVNPKMKLEHKKYFARSLDEISPDKINPTLIFCETQEQLSLFRSASSFWNVPVSEGYGRRIHIIVFDSFNYKVMGIVGLSDPVLNLSVRDCYIGWTKELKFKHLYNLMSAFILGAVQPYNQLITAKLIAMIAGCKEVSSYFQSKYNDKLVSIDTMAAFGQSAIYHSLKDWKFIGFTKGYTHYHITPDMWELIFDIAKELRIYNDNELWDFKKSNRKLNLLVKLLDRINIDRDILLTQNKRGYYFRPLAINWREFLTGQTDTVLYVNKTASEYIQIWKQKWLPKAVRKLQIKC